MAVQLSRRVDFPMVDMADVVYYPQYWDLCHRFFEESLLHITGISYPQMIMNHEIGLPVVHTECDYLLPLRYGDIINCTLWVDDVGESSTSWRYEYRNQKQELVWRGHVVTTCVNLKTFEKISLPDNIRTGLKACNSEEE